MSTRRDQHKAQKEMWLVSGLQDHNLQKDQQTAIPLWRQCCPLQIWTASIDRLVVVGGGWWLVIGGWWRLAVVGSWRLVAAGGWRRLVAVGGWRLVAVGG